MRRSLVLVVVAGTATVLAACGQGPDDGDPPPEADLLTVESLDVDYTRERLVARVQMEELDEERSHVVLQYEWDERAVDVVLEAFHRKGELVADGSWIDWNLEKAGDVRADGLDVDWDEATRTVTFTLRDRL